MDRVKTAEATLLTGTLVPLRPPLTQTWTAPATLPRVAAGAPLRKDASDKGPNTARDPQAVLDELVDKIDGVRGAVLASVDGFGIARSSSMDDEAAHPAMLAAAIGLAHQLVSMGGGRLLRQLVVDHDGGLMLVWPVGSERVLAVLAAPTVEQRRLRMFVQASVAQLAGAAT